METDGRPQGAGAVIDPRQHQPGHQILEHQQEIRDVPVHHRELLLDEMQSEIDEVVRGGEEQ